MSFLLFHRALHSMETLHTVLRDEFVQIVAKGSKRLERTLVKETLLAAVHTNLVAVVAALFVLVGPAQIAMPTSAEKCGRCSAQTCNSNTQRPGPMNTILRQGSPLLYSMIKGTEKN